MYVVHMYSEEHTASLFIMDVPIHMTRDRAVGMFGAELANHMHFDKPQEHVVTLSEDVYDVLESYVDRGPFLLVNLIHTIHDAFRHRQLRTFIADMQGRSKDDLIALRTLFNVYDKALATHVYVEKKDV